MGPVEGDRADGRVWSLATLASAVAANFEQMLVARFFIGLGEAAYGSVGLAVVLMVFAAATARASLTGAFMAGGSFGSVLGVFLGGILAVQLGWRWSFGVDGAHRPGAGRPIRCCQRPPLARHRARERPPPAATPPRTSAPSCARCLHPRGDLAYVGSGLQLFIAGSLFAWLPSYLNRAYGIAPDKAASRPPASSC